MITRKLKPCKTCGLPSYLFSKGRCRSCTLKEDYKPLKRMTDVKTKEILESLAELDIFFQEKRKEMTGFCANCGKPSCKNDDKYYKFSIAHILPKVYLKSVATHPDNWIELCFFHNSCHTNFDNGMLYLPDMKCFPLIIERFKRIYPFIAASERRRIPDIFLSYIDN